MMSVQCNKAVILAAGGGKRVRSLAGDKPKCLIDLAGRPIIEWVTHAVREAGIREVIVVTGFKAGTLKATLGDGAGQRISIEYIHNPEWAEPNGLSLYAVRRALEGERSFITLMSDHILPSSIIRSVVEARSTKCLLAVDEDISRIFDLSDATKVRMGDGVPVAIGKKLRTYDAVDCGLFRFDRRVFSALERSFARGRMSLTGGVKELIANRELDVLPVGIETFWIDIDTPQAYRQALKEIGAFTAGPKPGKGSRT
jgi:choline kinase